MSEIGVALVGLFMLASALLFILNKLFGRMGLLVFGAFAIVEANWQAAYPAMIFNGTIQVMTSAGTFTLIALAFAFMDFKYGKKWGFIYMITIVIAVIFIQFTSQLTLFANNSSVDLDWWNFTRLTVGDIVGFVASCLVMHLILVWFKSFTKLTYLVKIPVAMAVGLVVDAALFMTIAKAGTFDSVSDYFISFGSNAISKLIFTVISIILIFLLQEFKPLYFGPTILEDKNSLLQVEDEKKFLSKEEVFGDGQQDKKDQPK